MKNLLTLTFLLFASITFGQINTVGIIGSSTPNGWDSDSTMVQDPNDADVWTTTMSLITGEAKFRANDAWDINWGASDFPAGTGTQGGDNVPVPGAEYNITFNSATGEYNFEFLGTLYTSVGIIGDGVGGWDNDIDMTPVPNAPWVYSIQMEIMAGPVKFRADDAWDNNWGSTDFPVGVGTPGGDNIMVPVTGEYIVIFNSATGEYNFQSFIPEYTAIGIIGEGSPSGNWDDDTFMTQNPNNPHEWTLQASFNDGPAKFRADTAWTVNWGNDVFPMDTAVLDGPNIPVVAGEYIVIFNDITGAYNFMDPVVEYGTVGIIGSGTAVGWDNDIDLVKNPDPLKPDEWRTTLALKQGEVKFRADDDWAVNWGDTGFPTGTATQDGPNIPVFEGTWEITLNTTTGEYSFNNVSVGSIGPASPTGGWDSDEDMQADSTVGGLWTGVQNLTAGEFKMRQNDDWLINWGGDEFPTDLDATQDGPNIVIPNDGLWAISLLITQPHAPAQNDVSGEYSFMEVVSTDDDFLTVADVKLVPNPAKDIVKVNIEGHQLDGDINVRIFDMQGRILKVAKYNSVDNLEFDVSNYPTGTYSLQLLGEKFMISKRLVIVK